MIDLLYGTGVITLFTGSTLLCFTGIQKLILKKDESRKVIIDKLPESVQEHNKNKNELDFGSMKKEFQDCVEIFVRELSSNPAFNLNNFYQNFHPECIVKKYMSKFHYQGIYNSKLNVIELYALDFRKYIFHELFHMASANRYVVNSQFDGFRRIVKSKVGMIKSEIGTGLNEGYTELLSRRYFTKYGHEESNSYILLVSIALLLEKLVGADKMEYFYSTSDLYSLVLELSKYDSIENIVSILKKIDKLHFGLYESDNIFISRNSGKTYLEIFKMISELYAKAMCINQENILDYYRKLAYCMTIQEKSKNHKIGLKQTDKELILEGVGTSYLEHQNFRGKKV